MTSKTKTTTGKARPIKLIVLYGPPASGKETIGRELCRQLQATTFVSNNATNQFLASYLKPGSSVFHNAVDSLRIWLIKRLINCGRTAIFTFVFDGTRSECNFLRSLVNSVDELGGDVLFVRLDCSIQKLMERVSNLSRFGCGKITDQPHLKSLLELSNPHKSDIQFKKLTINTEQLSISDSVFLIRQLLSQSISSRDATAEEVPQNQPAFRLPLKGSVLI